MEGDGAQVQPAGSAGEGEQPFDYDGSTRELFRLWLGIFLLNVVTLGFYRFWGRTRIRKYLWSRVRLGGDRFEYDGTGGELFRRFLVALVIVVPLLSMEKIAVLTGLPIVWIAVLQGVQVILLVYLTFLAQYGGMRYRLSRTLWRGIRGGLDGHASLYALRGFGYSLLTPVTLGLAFPWQLIGLWRYMVRHAGFGDQDFSFEGTGRKLFGPFLASLGLFILALLLVMGVAVVIPMLTVGLSAVFGWRSQPGQPPPPGVIWSVVGAIVVSYVFLLFLALAAFTRFETRLYPYLARCTGFGGARFAAKVEFWPVFRLRFGNMLLMILTLGIAAPFVAHRGIRFFCDAVRIHDFAAIEALNQASGRRQRKGGEGLVQMLDTSGFA
jgi:uncharacterized membrane protein YjgN (DUF898 family)